MGRWSGTIEGGCGCLAAAAAAAGLGLPLLFVVALGDCPVTEDCHREDGLWLYGGGAVVLALAALLGFSVRALLGWAGRRGGGSARFPAWAALAGGAVLALLAWVAVQAWPYLND